MFRIEYDPNYIHRGERCSVSVRGSVVCSINELNGNGH